MVSNWAGVRPLIIEDGKRSAEITRKDELLVSESGIVSVAGGKLSGYRKVAERVVDSVAKSLRINKGCETDSITLSGGYVGSAEQFDAFVQKKVEEGVILGLSKEEALYLVKLYGSNVMNIYARIRTNKKQAESSISLQYFTPNFVTVLKKKWP